MAACWGNGADAADIGDDGAAGTGFTGAKVGGGIGVPYRLAMAAICGSLLFRELVGPGAGCRAVTTVPAALARVGLGVEGIALWPLARGNCLPLRGKYSQ